VRQGLAACQDLDLIHLKLASMEESMKQLESVELVTSTHSAGAADLMCLY